MEVNSVLRVFRNYHIVVVGCGGTGSNLVPHLAQLANSYKSEKISIVLADEDMVEPGNIGRQFFIEPDVGSNKARTLQIRYSTAWGVEIGYHSHYVREEGVLLRLLEPPGIHGGKPVLPILVGAVDNHYSRMIFHRVFYRMPTIAYVDAGNSEFAGQVVAGLRHKGETLLKPVADYYPDVLTVEDEISVGGTCGRKVEKEPQSLIANLWAAVTVLSFINNIVGVKKLPSHMATFNAHNIISRPEYVRSENSAKEG